MAISNIVGLVFGCVVIASWRTGWLAGRTEPDLKESEKLFAILCGWRYNKDMETTTAQPTIVDSTEVRTLISWKKAHALLAEMSDRKLEAMTTVVADSDISFSYTTGTDIDGVRVSCFRVTSHEPVLDGDWRELLAGHGALLGTYAEAKRFGLAMGYLVEYRRKAR